MDNNKKDNWEDFVTSESFRTEVEKLSKEQLEENIKSALFNILNEAETDIMSSLDREHSEKLGDVWGYSNGGDTCELVRDAVKPILAEVVAGWMKGRC